MLIEGLNKKVRIDNVLRLAKIIYWKTHVGTALMMIWASATPTQSIINVFVLYYQ